MKPFECPKCELLETDAVISNHYNYLNGSMDKMILIVCANCQIILKRRIIEQISERRLSDYGNTN